MQNNFAYCIMILHKKRKRNKCRKKHVSKRKKKGRNQALGGIKIFYLKREWLARKLQLYRVSNKKKGERSCHKNGKNVAFPM